MNSTKNEQELAILFNLLDGFDQQALAIPTLCEKVLVEANLMSENQIEEAKELYKKIMTDTIAGTDLNTATLTGYYIAAELVLQRKKLLLEKMQLEPPQKKDDFEGYG